MNTVSSRSVTQKDVAALAGTSQVAVSVVLNGGSASTHISDALRQRILAAAETVAYRPNQAARALRTGKARSVALYTARAFDPFYGQFIDYLTRLARGDGYMLTVHEADRSGGNPANDDAFWQIPKDGIIVVETMPPFLHAGRAMKSVPVVVITTSKAGEPVGDTVNIDLSRGSRQRIEHLIGSGRKRIAYLTDAEGITEIDPRFRYYRELMARSNLPECVITIPEVSSEASWRTLREYLAVYGAPEAIAARNDTIAFGACRALREFGLSIPQDVSIVGCDDLVNDEYFHPRLSSIRMPIEEACANSWAFLMNRMREPSRPPQHSALHSELILRDSC